MNYRLIQFYANRFPAKEREDCFNDGCVAVLSGKDIYHYMVDEYRRWTKGHYRRRDPHRHYRYEPCDGLSFEFDICGAIYLKEMAPRLHAELRKLRPSRLVLIYLRYWRGMKLHEIGKLLGITESAVSRQHKKILHYLRNRFIGTRFPAGGAMNGRTAC